MKRQKYTEDFERLWQSFDIAFGDKGVKTKAYEVFCKMEIDTQDVSYIIKCYNRQKAVKAEQRANGQFSPNFQAVERYLRNERFDDEVSAEAYRQVEQLTKSEQADQKLKQYLARVHGEGMAYITGDEKSH